METTIRKDATNCPRCCSQCVERICSAQHFTANTAQPISVDTHSLVDECLSWLKISPAILKFYNSSTRLNYKPILPMIPQLKGRLIFNCVHFNHYHLQGMFTWLKVEVPLQAEKMIFKKEPFLSSYVCSKKDKILKEKKSSGKTRRSLFAVSVQRTWCEACW